MGDCTGKRRTMSRAERELKLDELASHLKGVEAIEFAYAHGSFVKQDRFGDIDVAVFFSEGCSADKRLDLALELSVELSNEIRVPVDVQPLNSASLGFCFHAVRGRQLVSKDEDRRLDYVKTTLLKYFDYRPIIEQSAKALLSRGRDQVE